MNTQENSERDSVESTDLFSPIDSDRGFLMWIHDRMEHVHGESELVDYMHRFRAIIASMDGEKWTPSAGQGQNGMKELQTKILRENAPISRP